MTEELAPYGSTDTAAIMERVIVVGDLEKLTPAERVSYYLQTCRSLGLNPLTRPFEYLRLRDRGLTLYARKDCTDQLRARHKISFAPPKMQQVGDVYVVTIVAQTMDGRTDTDIGVVPVKGLSGADLANAFMKAVTKAKRRVTLSICGLGWLDESERDTLPQAATDSLPVVDLETGEILDRGQVKLWLEGEVPFPPRPQGNGERITELQHRAIEAMITRSGLNRERVKLWLKAESLIPVEGHLTDISKRVASQMIDRWDDVLHRYQDWALGHGAGEAEEGSVDG